jgi:hypothetical protein
VNLLEERKIQLRQLPVEKKWLMLVNTLSDRFFTGTQEVLMEIKEIEKLRSGQNRKVLTDLAVSLRSRPMRWINEFMEHG